MARNMRHLLVMGADTTYGQGIIQGIHNYCSRHGSWIYRLEDDKSVEGLRRAGYVIRGWRVDGIIAQIRVKRVERLVRSSGVPAVNVSGVYATDLPTVINDNHAIGEMTAAHFLNSGFRNFGFCARTSELYTHQRCDGFVRKLREAGYGCNVFADQEDTRVRADWVKYNRLCQRWLMSLRKPVAVMCIYDYQGLELALACRQMGLRVPSDVAITGVGNETLICRISSPPLSSVVVGLERIGYEAARMLDRMVRGRGRPAKPKLIPPQRMIVRQSSDIIAIDDAVVAAALRYIREHLAEGVSIKQLVQNMPVSRRTLEMAFQEHLGRTIHEEIVRAQVHRASSLLEDGDLPIARIAGECGLRRGSRLSILFKQELGETPLEYRRKRQRRVF